MAKKFAEITGVHKIFKSETPTEGPNIGKTVYTEMYITDSELQKNIDKNTIVFVTVDNDDVDKIIGPNNYKISKDDCFIITQNKVYATFGKVNVSDVMGPTGPTGDPGSQYIQVNSADSVFESDASNIISGYKFRVGDYSISNDTNTIWTCISNTEFSSGPSIKGDSGQAATSDSMPIGSVIMLASDEAPDGWLFCNGQQIEVSYKDGSLICIERYKEFQELVNRIGSKYFNYDEKFIGKTDVFGETLSDLNADGDTYYIQIPDFRNVFPRGGRQYYQFGGYGGESEVTLKLDNIPYHKHYIQGVNVVNNSGPDGDSISVVQGGAKVTSTNFETDLMGTKNNDNNLQPFDIIPPFVYINFIIKYK